MSITQEELKNIFSYREDGRLIWKVRASKKTHIGQPAGYRCSKNHNIEMIMVNKHLYKSSRLIFLFHHGYLPLIVDHKDRNPENNKIDNLRPATYFENSRNMSARKKATSKYIGVNYDKLRSKWLARIRINGKSKNLGRFDIEEDAALAYNKMAALHYKEFANLNVLP